MIQQPPDVTTAVAAASITIGGVATGLDYAVLLAGFAGGLVSLSFLPPMSIWRRIWTPVTATLTAGYASPVATYYLAQWVGAPEVAESFELFAAFATGVVTQFAIPAFIKIAQRRFEKMASRGGASQ